MNTNLKPRLYETVESHLVRNYPYTSISQFRQIGDIIGKAEKGFIVTDLVGSICYTNERLSEISEYYSDELLGANPRIFQSGNTNLSTYRRIWSEISSGKSWRGTLQNRRKKGSRYLEDIIIMPITKENGEITHFAGIIEELKNSSIPWPKRTPYKIDEMCTVAKGFSTKLNEISAGIIGHCSHLRNTLSNTENVLHCSSAIKTLSSRLADFGERLSYCEGNELFNSTLIDLRSEVSTTLDDLENDRRLDNLQCFMCGSHISVWGDSKLIQTAVTNLVLNSLEANETCKNEISLTVGTHRWNGASFAQDRICFDFGLPQGKAGIIQLKDEANGMDTYLLERACDLFFSTKSDHHGLGLPVVLGIMKSHRGAIEIVSKVKTGTTVSLFFPVDKIRGITTR